MIDTLLRALDFVVLNVVEWRLRRTHRNVYGGFRYHFGYTPRISTPTNTSEMTQWRKVFDHNPVFVTLSDKLAVKKWVADRDARVKIAPVLWSGKDPDQMPVDLPDLNVVMKTNHGCEFNYFPGEAAPFDRDAVIAKLKAWMKIDYSTVNGEWAYSEVPRYCFIERLIGPRKNLVDIVYRCHNGRCTSVVVTVNEKTPHMMRGYFGADGSTTDSPLNKLSASFSLPERFFEARVVAERLSEGFDYVRVDFIFSGDDFFFNEMTVYPAAGYAPETKESEKIFAAWLANIDQCWFLYRKSHSFLSSLYRDAVIRHFQKMRADRR